MSVLRAEKDRVGQEPWTLEESDVDCRNLPESCFLSRKREEAEAGENPAPSAPSESPELQDSDCYPSLFLAAFLTLVFVLVSLLLLHHDNRHFHLDGCLGLRTNQGPQTENNLGGLCLLFPSQPEATWQTLRRFARGQSVRSHPDGSGILVAVGFGEARGPLLCLVKAALLFLTQERALRVQFPEHSGAWHSWTSLCADGTRGFSAAEIYVGRNRVPSGLLVSLRSAALSLALLLNGTERAREEFLLHPSTPVLVSDILSAIRFAEGTPEALMTANSSVPVILVKSEQYLDGGLAC